MNSTIIREDCIKLINNFNEVNKLFNKTYLITGSNGLVGNYLVNLFSLVNHLYKAKIKVYCISKHAPVWKDDRFVYITQDLSHHFTFKYPVDYILHCACYGRPKKFLENELETISLNINATKTLLDTARTNKAKLVFLSTSEIYGNPPPEEIPTKESYPGNSLTSSSRAAYVESKRLGEALCYIYNRKYDIGSRVARMALVYGPGITIHDERVMGNFMKNASVYKHIKLMDAGKGLRTYCYITDALNMLLKIMVLGKDVIYNVGGTETVSIYKMAQLVASYYGATYEASSASGLKDAPDIVKLDVSKACNEFGIHTFTPFKEGLKRTMDWNANR